MAVFIDNSRFERVDERGTGTFGREQCRSDIWTKS